MVNFFDVAKNRKRGIHKSKRDFKLHVSEWLYPSIGVKAWWKYIMLTLKRKPISSHKLALGFSFGAFASFTPFMGFHGLIGIILSRIFGGSMVAALIGTIVGNPWTFPLIWVWSAKFGHFILHDKVVHHQPIHLTDLTPTKLFTEFGMYWDMYLYPMTVGGVPTGILAGLIFYFIIKYQIDKYRQVRIALLQKRRKELRMKKLKDIKSKIVKVIDGKVKNK